MANFARILTTRRVAVVFIICTDLCRFSRNSPKSLPKTRIVKKMCAFTLWSNVSTHRAIVRRMFIETDPDSLFVNAIAKHFVERMRADVLRVEVLSKEPSPPLVAVDWASAWRTKEAERVERWRADADRRRKGKPRPVRRAFSQRLSVRWLVLAHGHFRCAHCGARASDGVVLHVDHIRPLARGGSDELVNLQALCGPCNLGKSTHLEP